MLWWVNGSDGTAVSSIRLQVHWLVRHCEIVWKNSFQLAISLQHRHTTLFHCLMTVLHVWVLLLFTAFLCSTVSIVSILRRILWNCKSNFRSLWKYTSCFRNVSRLHVSFSSAVVDTRTRDLYEAIRPCLQVHTLASLYLYDKFHQSSDVKVCQCLRSASTSSLVRRTRCSSNFHPSPSSFSWGRWTLCHRASRRRSHWLVCRKRLKTHLLRHFFFQPLQFLRDDLVISDTLIVLTYLLTIELTSLWLLTVNA